MPLGEIKRHVSLEEDFMNHYIDDIMYAYLLAHATQDQEKRVYLARDNYLKLRLSLQKICSLTPKTLKRHFDKLISKGLIVEIETLAGNGKTIPAYLFPEPKSRYQTVSVEMLDWLARGGNTHAIQIYVYLLNKITWKKDYTFSVSELMRALGYNETSHEARKTIGVILVELQKLELLGIEDMVVVLQVGNQQIPSPMMKLSYISTEVPKDLKEGYKKIMREDENGFRF